jgi:hypothetical protein
MVGSSKGIEPEVERERRAKLQYQRLLPQLEIRRVSSQVASERVAQPPVQMTGRSMRHLRTSHSSYDAVEDGAARTDCMAKRYHV